MFVRVAWIALLLAGSPAQDASRGGAPVTPQTRATQQEKQGVTSAAAAFRITGRVVNSMTGAPVAGAYVVMAAAAPPNLNRTERAGTDGSFAFTQLSAGRYLLVARRKGYVEQMFLQHEQFTTAILVGPNLNSENLVFPLPPEGAISGEVTDEAGEPIRSAKMLLFAEDTEGGRHVKHFKAQQTTDEEGQYRFGSLTRGNYYLAVEAEPWYAEYARFNRSSFHDETAGEKSGLQNPNLDLVYPITYYPNATEANGAAAIRVDAGGSVRADMRLVPVPALHIRLVVDVDQGNLDTFTQVLVKQTILGTYEDYIRNQSQQVLGDRGSETGEDAEADQHSGPLYMEVGGLRPGPCVLEVVTAKPGEARHSGGATKWVPVDPTDGQTLDVRGIAPAGGVSGTLKLEGNATAPLGVNVFLRDASTGTAFRASVDSTGGFRFSDELAPGVYGVTAAGPGGLQLRSVTASGAKVTGHKIEISSGSDAQLIVTLARGVNAHVKGIVERAGKSTPGMMVVLVPEDLRESTEYRRDQSDSDGSFSLNQVSPGKYTVVAVKDWDLEWAKPEVIREYLAGGTPVEVAGGEERDVKVTAK